MFILDDEARLLANPDHPTRTKRVKVWVTRRHFLEGLGSMTRAEGVEAWDRWWCSVGPPRRRQGWLGWLWKGWWDDSDAISVGLDLFYSITPLDPWH